MNALFKSFLIAIIPVIIKASLEDVEVIISDMPENMEKFAVGQTITALSMESDFNLVAKEVIDQMNRRFGSEWVMIIGTHLNPLIIGTRVQNHTYLLFSYKATHLVLFKQELVSSGEKQKTFLELMDSALKASVDVIGSTNTTTLNKMISLAKNVLSKDYKNCHSKDLSKDIREWCFRDISLSFVDAINGEDEYRDVYTVTVGLSNYCVTQFLGLNVEEAYLFLLDSIYFQIVKV